MYKAAYLLKHRWCDSSDKLKKFWKLIKYSKSAAKYWPYWILLSAHNLPIFQPILMICVSKSMVHRALSDKTYLSLGLLSPLSTDQVKMNGWMCIHGYYVGLIFYCWSYIFIYLWFTEIISMILSFKAYFFLAPDLYAFHHYLFTMFILF